MISTTLCQRLGIEFPIVSAPMGPDLSASALVSAVSAAGGLGILQFQLASPEDMRNEIRAIRERTNRPFGVNFILTFPYDENLSVCLEEKVPLLHFYWGELDPELVDRVHGAGSLVAHQVGSVEAAQMSAEAGADVIVAQGIEAGGHVCGTMSTMALVPQVVDAVAPVPVMAAGGIADGRGVAAALCLGAQAAVLGTRFLATPEARAHGSYKQRIIATPAAETVVTRIFGHGWPDAPHRAIRTPFVEEWLGNESRGQEQRPDEPPVGQVKIAGREFPLLRFMGFPPNEDASGDIDSMYLGAGQSAGAVREIKPAAEIVRQLVAEAEELLGG